jgi:hypothetical protein
MMVDGWDVAFHANVDALVEHGHVNAATLAPLYGPEGVAAIDAQVGSAPPARLGALFAGFFHYYGYEFDWTRQTV